MEEEVDSLYMLLEKSKCASYYDTFKDLGITLDDLVILEKEDLAQTIKEPLLCSLLWRNLLIIKEQQQRERELLECGGIQIEDGGHDESTRKRKAKGVLLEERLSKKQHIVLKNVSLTNLPSEKPTDSDYKKIAEQVLNYLKKTNITKLRHGQLDGLCGFLICKYPVLDEGKYSGYEILKSKIVNVLRNFRSFEKKKLKTDEASNGNDHRQEQPQYILCITSN